MGDINQLLFIKKHIDKVKSPILEVGSKDYGNTQDLRSLFKDADYTGIDMEDGKGVDIVLDLTEDFNYVDAKLKNKRFQIIICFSVLEHCADPFKMCSNIEKLLKKDGMVFVSVPFSWRIHGYPDDYWRFTPEGIKKLFPGLEFDLKEGCLSTGKEGVAEPIDDYMLRVELDLKKADVRKLYSRANILFLRLLRKMRVLEWISDNPYLFPPVTINMIGKKKTDL
jgi:SAM-dependent methyltransferase